jgi:hypothetical protein
VSDFDQQVLDAIRPPSDTVQGIAKTVGQEPAIVHAALRRLRASGHTKVQRDVTGIEWWSRRQPAGTI